MYKFLSALFASEKFLAADLKLHVYPTLSSLKLDGFIELRKYKEDKIETHASEIKEALKLIIEECKAPIVVEVRSSPCLKPMKETMYEFSASQKFESKEDKLKEVKEMQKDAVLDVHSFPVNEAALIAKLEKEKGIKFDKENHEHYGNYN